MSNREIKFRAWDEYKNEMIYFDLTRNCWDDIAHCEIMQYTGLNDKNRVEVYKGDIVKFHDHPTGVEDDEKVSLDADGSIIKGEKESYIQRVYRSYFTPVSFGLMSNIETNKKENEHLYKTDLSENGTLQILGILLYEKQQQRQNLINKLKGFGVNI